MNTIYLIFKINLGATIPTRWPLWPPGSCSPEPLYRLEGRSARLIRGPGGGISILRYLPGPGVEPHG
jgi:hypothetical protein